MRTLALVVAVLVCAGPAAAQSTFFAFRSQPGDYIGQGEVVSITAGPGIITAVRNVDNGVSVAIATDGTTQATTWDADFAAAGAVPLTAGTYLNATRFPFNAATVPGLTISGDGRGCNTLTGAFTVLEVVFGAGDVVTAFAADFEQHCEGMIPALVGAVRFNSSVPPPVTVTPATLVVGPGAATTTLQAVGFPGVPWTASTSTPWLSVPGSGAALALPVTIARNPTTTPRTGMLRVGNTTVVVTQRANGLPGAPQALVAATTQGTLQLGWQPPDVGGDATSYRLEAGTQPGASSIVVDLASAALSATFPGVPPGRYFLRLVGSNEFGTGAASEEFVLDMTSGTTVPGRPRILAAAVVDGVLTMTWEAPVPTGEVSGYILEAGTVANVMNLGSYRLGPATSFAYRMRFGGIYFLRLRAVNGAGVGSPSAEMMVRAGTYMAPPPAPEGLSATVNGSTVTLTWIAPVSLPGEEATRYRLEGGPAPGTTTVTAYVPVATPTATFVAVPSGRYYVRVRGDSLRGPGVASNEIRVVVP